MASKPIRIPAPIKGLSDDTAYADQPPGTTREALNARAIESKTGRTRLSQRSGLGLYDANGAQINETAIVQDIIAVSKNEDLLTWATDATPDNVFAKQLPRSSTGGASNACVDMRMDPYGNVFAAGPIVVTKYNSDGEVLAEIPIPDADASSVNVAIGAIDIDEFGNLLVAVGGPNSDVGALHLFEAQLDGTFREAWRLDSGEFFNDVAAYEGDIYVTTSTLKPGTASQQSYFRVYPAYGLTEAPVENADVSVDLTAAVTGTDLYGTRLAVRDDGVAYVCGVDTGATTACDTFIAKLSPGGSTPQTPVWIIESLAEDLGGLGYGIICGPKATEGEYTIYSYGPVGTAATDTNHVRRIVDEGTSADTSGGDSWEATVAEAPADTVTFRYNRPATDFDGYLYIATSGTGTHKSVEIFQSDGTALNDFSEALDDSANGGYCCAVTQEEKPKGSAEEEVEFVYWGTNAGTASTFYAFFKQRMLTVSQGSGTMRSLVRLAVSDGDIVKFTTSATSDPAGGTGVAQLDSSAPYVSSVAFGEEVFWVDGKNNVKYSVADDAVSDWLSKTSQPIPPRCRIIETWRGRVVLGRDPEDPQLWHMSAVGNAYDWDNFPAVSTVTQAISGVNAKAGKVPDIVNAIVPWDDDLCLFGGDRSIWRLTGDPLAGGQFDLVSDETGMAFGRCWTKDPIGGRLFFAGSRGGIYMMERNSLPVRISRDWIERRLQDDVDFSTHFLRLVWNYRDEGLHVFQCPFAGNEGTVVKHWFWDAKNGGWWEDQFGDSDNTEPQPCAVFVVDGDTASDRKLLVGGEDGRIRVWDEAKLHDELTTTTNQAIKWKVVLGPLLPSNLDREFRFRRFTAVLARNLSGCSYRFYAPDEADHLGPVLLSGSLEPGRNAGAQARFRGPNAYLQLSNMQTSQRCAVESLLIHAAPCGRVRSRK